MPHNKRILCALLALTMMLSGCGGGGSGGGSSGGGGSSKPSGGAPASSSGATQEQQDAAQEAVDALQKGETAEAPAKPYEAPPMATSSYHSDAAEGDGGVYVDFSAVSSGYIGVSGTSDSGLVCLVYWNDNTDYYYYDMPNDGTPVIVPLQNGNGKYAVRIMQNVEGKGYLELYSTSTEVTLEDEFQPFLRPNINIDYNEGSACVKKGAELASKAGDALGVVSQVFDYVRNNVTYDIDKAKAMQAQSDPSRYVPNPDATLASGKGICSDYATLVAAMLRSQGIPTKMVYGHVKAPDGSEVPYHAWNMFWTDETGWITVEYAVNTKNWNRLDLTFSAQGAPDNYVNDEGNYIGTEYF